MRSQGPSRHRRRPRAATGATPSVASPGAGTTPPADRGGAALAGWLVEGLIWILAAIALVQLWRQAAPAVFASDECFHAYLAEWIAGHRRLPRELPEFYSGLPYFYPPLFHLLGAATLGLAGPGSLRFLNVVLTGLLLVSLRVLPIPGVPAVARRCAVLVCLATPALSFYAVRFYAETLATVLAVLAVALLLGTRAGAGTLAAPRQGVLLGIAVGVAVLAKQPAVLLPVLLAVLAAGDLARGERRQAAAMATALAVAMVVASPFFIRNLLLFGSPFDPPVATPAQLALDRMNTRLFSLPPPAFYRHALEAMGPIVPWLAALALAWRLVRRRFDLVTGWLAACAAFVLLGPFVPRLQPRHLNPVTATLALVGAIALLDRPWRRRWVLLAVQALLLVWAGLSLTRLGGLRGGFDASAADREAYRAIAAQVPPGATVLSRLTYDTFFHARRNATWPVPWGNTAGQLALFTEADPERFLATLDRLAIGYLLVPRRPGGRVFTGTNYPESFLRCVATLVEGGRLRVLWGSDDLVLVARAD